MNLLDWAEIVVESDEHCVVIDVDCVAVAGHRAHCVCSA